MKVYVPINSFGIKELERLIEEQSENLKIFEFSDEDYFYFQKYKYFDFLNVECGCIIDLYEDDDITNEKLPIAIEITEILMNQFDDIKFIDLCNRMISIFKLALISGTYVNIYCYLENDKIYE